MQPPKLAPSEDARSRPGTAVNRRQPDRRFENLISGGMDIIDDGGNSERPGSVNPPSN